MAPAPPVGDVPATEPTASDPAATTTPPDSTVITAVPLSPKVLSSNPADGATDVDLDGAITAEVSIPNGGINAATLTPKTVRLVRTSDNHDVPAALNTSGGGDVIVLTPRTPLEPKTQYAFIVTAELTDVTGTHFAPIRRAFTTAAAPAGTALPGVSFDQVALTKSDGHDFFGLVIGPDHQLYASTNDGLILRFPLRSDGTLGEPKTIDTIRSSSGGPRFVVGMAFDPHSTADDPVLWVTHSGTSALDIGGTAGDDWTGKVSRLSGSDLSVYHDAVVGLPRSVRDHVTNQPVFGPDGAIYLSQPSNSAMGAPDAPWRQRPERLLNASILRLDLGKLGETTLNARTDAQGLYNPYAPGAPLTIYASGVRNSYDLVWSGGKLYGAANGSASGGATPAGPNVPAIPQVLESETDYLFRIDQGYYYGHPNPRQSHFVLNGGNPTDGIDPYEVSQYPVGTNPDPKWRPAILNLGPHQAPVGMVIYRGSAFSGTLDGKLLVARYSGGDDVIAIDISQGAQGKARQFARINGLSGLNNPTDLVQDPQTGFLYVAELGNRRLRLLRPTGTVVTAPSPEPVDPPVSEPPLVEPPVVSAPPTIPDDQRTKKDRSLMKSIEKYAAKHALTMPDLSIVPGTDLKATLSALKAEAKRQKWARKVIAYAAKRSLELTGDVADESYDQLRALYSLLKHTPKAV